MRSSSIGNRAGGDPLLASFPPSPSFAAPGALVAPLATWGSLRFFRGLAFLWSFESSSVLRPCGLALLGCSVPSRRLCGGPASLLRLPAVAFPVPFPLSVSALGGGTLAPTDLEGPRPQAPKTNRILNQMIFGSGLRPYDGSTSAHLCDSAYTRQLVRVICLPCMVFIIFCFGFHDYMQSHTCAHTHTSVGLVCLSMYI